MTRSPLERANRAVLRAIETPPESGREQRLDEVAAWLHRLSSERRAPDDGHLARLSYRLHALAEQAHEERARRLRRARDAVVDHWERTS